MSSAALAAAPPAACAVDIQGLEKCFGQVRVLRGIDPSVHQGERVLVCGPSGSGKSTMIRAELHAARRVADKVVFMDDGHIIESRAQDSILLRPRHERTRGFLTQLMP